MLLEDLRKLLSSSAPVRCVCTASHPQWIFKSAPVEILLDLLDSYVCKQRKLLVNIHKSTRINILREIKNNFWQKHALSRNIPLQQTSNCFATLGMKRYPKITGFEGDGGGMLSSIILVSIQWDTFLPLLTLFENVVHWHWYRHWHLGVMKT